MARKLKVFSAEMGFVRAVVAAPSRKAALEAWGVRDDLFARGTAREVDDADLVKRALESPGDVLKIPVASDAAILSAGAGRGAEKSAKSKPKAKPAKSKPAPARDALEKAQDALAKAQAERKTALKALDAKQAAVEEERRSVEAEHERALKRLQTAHDREKRLYEAALEAWEG